MKKKFLFLSLFFILNNLSTYANEYESLSVIASLDHEDKKRISHSTPTTDGTNIFVEKTNETGDIYWLDRSKFSSYHLSLDAYKPEFGAFSEEDIQYLQQILEKYEESARNLNEDIHEDGKYYVANGHKISLFVHNFGNKIRSNKTFTIENIDQLREFFDEANSANIVVTIDSNQKLKEDWLETRDQILSNPQFKRKNHHRGLNEHITIATLYKCDGNEFEIKKGFVQSKKNSRKRTTSIPFTDSDLDSIAEVFKAVHNNFTPIPNIVLDTLTTTTKQNGHYKKLYDVTFSTK